LSPKSYIRFSILAPVTVVLVEKTHLFSTNFAWWVTAVEGLKNGRPPIRHFTSSIFLASLHKNFFVALICCPFCLSTWFTFGLTVSFWRDVSSLSWMGVTYLLVLGTYVLISKSKDWLN